MKTKLGLLLVAVAAGTGAFYYWRDRPVDRPEFRTLMVTRGELLVAISATGTVEPVEIIDVGAQIVGSIKSFGPDRDRPGKTIDYRSRVKRGDVLAQLDDSPHQADLDRARAALLVAEAEAKRSLARKVQLEREAKRVEKLRDTMSIGEFEKAQADSETAQAELTMSEARVEQARIAAKQAEINLTYTTIRSPIDGVVIDRRVNVGQTMVAGLNAPSLFLLARDLSHLVVWASVNEADIGEVHVGQRVTFKVDAYRDQIFVGRVSQIRLNASLQQNVVSYGVVVDVDSPDGKLLPYMTAKLQFEVARRSHVVLVPNQALAWRPTWSQLSPSARSGLKPPTAVRRPARQDARTDDVAEPAELIEPRVEVEQPTVWVLAEDGLVRPVAIKVGLTDGMTTEVTGGNLALDTAVVVNAVQRAKPDFVSGFISKVTR
jgi:HlyD family secretion protein